MNGYFSMGKTPQYTSLDYFPGSSSYSVVAPFAADIDTSRTGSVKYTQFTTTDSSQMSRVSTFIRSQTGNSFYGTKMMVAEWNGVPEYGESTVSCKVSTYCTMFLHRKKVCEEQTKEPANSCFEPVGPHQYMAALR